jgi:hypothetical protein
MPRYLCSIPDVKGSGPIPEIISDDQDAIETFVETWDRPGRSLYECVATLKPGATRRCLETVGALHFIHVDIDLRTLDTPQDEVLARLQALPLPLEIRDSGGGFHVIPLLKEPAEAGTPEFERINRARKRLTRTLCGDPAPDHAAALLRVVGSHNFKYGEPRPCRVIQTGAPTDLTEIEELVDLLADNPLFVARQKPNGAANGSGEHTTRPVEDLLGTMKFEGGENGFHASELSATAKLLNQGVSVTIAVQEVLEAAKLCARQRQSLRQLELGRRRACHSADVH